MTAAEDKIIRNPVKAIRAHCLDCCSGSSKEISLCPVNDCPLYPFRFGKNPYRTARNLTSEQRKAMADRLQKARQAKYDIGALQE